MFFLFSWLKQVCKGEKKNWAWGLFFNICRKFSTQLMTTFGRQMTVKFFVITQTIMISVES